MSGFASFFLNAEAKTPKRAKCVENDPLTPAERALYADLNIKYINSTSQRSVFDQAPKGMDDPKARHVLIALLNIERQQLMVDKQRHDAVVRELEDLKKKNERLENTLQNLSFVQKTMEESRDLQDMIFKMSTEAKEMEKEHKATQKRLLNASTHWSNHYREEMAKMREQAISELESVHWDFMDKVVNPKMEPDMRDQVIYYMELARLVLNKMAT